MFRAIAPRRISFKISETYSNLVKGLLQTQILTGAQEDIHSPKHDPSQATLRS